MSEGISTSGGNISGGQFVVGMSGGHVEQHSSTGPSSDALERLTALLDRHAADLPEGEEAHEDLADIRAQLVKDKPDGRRLADTLRRLSERVVSIGSLAGAVRDLAKSLGI